MSRVLLNEVGNAGKVAIKFISEVIKRICSVDSNRGALHGDWATCNIRHCNWVGCNIGYSDFNSPFVNISSSVEDREIANIFLEIKDDFSELFPRSRIDVERHGQSQFNLTLELVVDDICSVFFNIDDEVVRHRKTVKFYDTNIIQCSREMLVMEKLNDITNRENNIRIQEWDLIIFMMLITGEKFNMYILSEECKGYDLPTGIYTSNYWLELANMCTDVDRLLRPSVHIIPNDFAEKVMSFLNYYQIGDMQEHKFN